MKKINLLFVALIILFGCSEVPDGSEKTGNEEAFPISEETISKEELQTEIPQEKASEPEDIPNKLCSMLPLTSELSPADKFFCLAVVNNDPEFCQEIKGDEGEIDEDAEKNKNICLAVSKADTSYCKNIQDISAKHVCYYQTAVINKNINICDEIDFGGENERLQCYFNFVSNKYWWDKSDEIKEEDCNKFPANEPDKNTCLAFKERDVSRCGNNVNCLTFFKQDMSFCSGKGSVLKDCIRDRAMVNKDFSICETLSGEKRDDCIGDFCTHISLDSALCEKISDDMERQSRYMEVAMHMARNQR
ncbi:hypothetical protein JXB27_03900 [Candidatus Woesearchaeota archaeon]|nr:hypothetical protein [Candidatus Woesearchaeota archaeon]